MAAKGKYVNACSNIEQTAHPVDNGRGPGTSLIVLNL